MELPMMLPQPLKANRVTQRFMTVMSVQVSLYANVRIRMLTILPISVAEYFRRVVVRIWKYVWRKLFLT